MRFWLFWTNSPKKRYINLSCYHYQKEKLRLEGMHIMMVVSSPQIQTDVLLFAIAESTSIGKNSFSFSTDVTISDITALG
jgi:hypothetical protein